MNMLEILHKKNDVNPDDELINKLKCASNKSEIKRNVYKKLEDFTNLISIMNSLNITRLGISRDLRNKYNFH